MGDIVMALLTGVFIMAASLAVWITAMAIWIIRQHKRTMDERERPWDHAHSNAHRRYKNGERL